MMIHPKEFLVYIRALTIVLLAAGPAFAQDEGAAGTRYCEVTMDFKVNGHAVASPDTIVEFGKQAEVTIRDANGVHGWRITFVVDAPSVVRRASVMPAQFQLFELANEQAFLRAEPHLNIVPGQPATLEMAFDDGRKASFGVVTQIRSEAEVKARLDAAEESSN